MKLLRYGKRDGAADAAADHADLFEAFRFGRSAERPDEIGQAVAHLFMVEFFRSCADDLEYNRDGALFAVVIHNREGNTFSVFVHTQNDKLSGQCFLCDKRSVHFHQSDRRVQRLLFDNPIHLLKHLLVFLSRCFVSYILAPYFIISYFLKLSIPNGGFLRFL